MKLFNSLTRRVEEVKPREMGKIGIYTCGPTVYSTLTIGNFRTYTLADILVRSLRLLGYEVKDVMNITDVGHLTGDNEGDASQGEDRLEKAAKKTGQSAWEISRGYTAEFLEHMKLMNILPPEIMCKATDHIPEQITMIKQLEAKGFVYKIADGMYFDVGQFERMGFKYGELSTLDQIKFGARLEPNPEKKDPRDFALWKFSPEGERRQMEWDSPWGVGFPGWHIECSAMSTKYLGSQFEIHVGGEDLRSTHHPNEIAQSEGATGKRPFVKYWVHGAFLLVDGGRMGKSLGNAYTIADILQRGIDPLALRYFYLTGHYRKQLNFTWEGLSGAEAALTKLRRAYAGASTDQSGRTAMSQEKMEKIEKYQQEFSSAVESDLDMPGALATVWELVKSNVPNYDKVELLAEWDRVLGLDLARTEKPEPIPTEIEELIVKREEARKQNDFTRSDKLRSEIEAKGWKIEDRKGKTSVVKL